MDKLKAELARLRGLKLHRFDDFEVVLRRVRNKYGNLFPKLTVNRKGSRYVFDFGVPELNPISLEKEHGPREYIPRYFAKLAMHGIEEVVAYIEAHVVLPEASELSGDSPPDEEDKSDDEGPGTFPET